MEFLALCFYQAYDISLISKCEMIKREESKTIREICQYTPDPISLKYHPSSQYDLKHTPDQFDTRRSFYSKVK